MLKVTIKYDGAGAVVKGLTEMLEENNPLTVDNLDPTINNPIWNIAHIPCKPYQTGHSMI